MSQSLSDYLIQTINRINPPQYQEFLDRVSQGQLTRDENPASHFSTFFVAIDISQKQVFIGHHKKADLWIFNGGHIDLGELPHATIRREMLEEWGIDPVPNIDLTPQLLTITQINKNNIRKCRTHFDIWYFIPVNKNTFHPDQKLLSTEFFQTKWMSITDAKIIAVDPNMQIGLDFINQNYF
jgi:8-oxo-dGTP pyrophosphatase MutT (NUDIX family)